MKLALALLLFALPALADPVRVEGLCQSPTLRDVGGNIYVSCGVRIALVIEGPCRPGQVPRLYHGRWESYVICGATYNPMVTPPRPTQTFNIGDQ